MVNFPTWIPDCDSQSPALLDLFVSPYTSICSTIVFPLLRNSDHVTVSVSIALEYWVGVQRGSLTSSGEGASLVLVGNPSSDGFMIKMPYGLDILHPPVSDPIFSYCVG